MKLKMIIALTSVCFFPVTATNAQQAYWVDSSGSGRGEAQLEESKSSCSFEASQAYDEYFRDQNERYGPPRNALIVIARAAAGNKLQEKVFYRCMGRDSWSFVDR